MIKKQKIEKVQKVLSTPYYDGVYDINIKNKEELINVIINEYDRTRNMSNDAYKSGNSNNGGTIRKCNGDFAEEAMKLILGSLCNIHNIQNYQIYNGRTKPIRVFSKNGHADISVDVHAHILKKSTNKTINLFSECKSNLDKTYITRANADFSYIKKENKKNKTLIFSLQQALSNETQNFYKDQNNIDQISYVFDSIRSAKKALWKEEYFQDMNRDKLRKLIDYVEKLIK